MLELDLLLLALFQSYSPFIVLQIDSWWSELLACFNYYITICFLWFSWKFVSLTFLELSKIG